MLFTPTNDRSNDFVLKAESSINFSLLFISLKPCHWILSLFL